MFYIAFYKTKACIIILKTIVGVIIFIQRYTFYGNLNQQTLQKISLSVRGCFSIYYKHSSTKQYTIGLD